MTITLSPTELRALRPCSDRTHLFGGRSRMNAAQALSAGATIPDLLWVAAKLGRKDLVVRFALACAQRVAHHNSDPRVQAALDATQNWLNDPTEQARRSAGPAGSDAYAAGSDAYAVGSAAYAADAVGSAAYAAGSGAYAAAYAARSAAYAAYAARYAAYAAGSDPDTAAEQKEQRRIFLEIFN